MGDDLAAGKIDDGDLRPRRPIELHGKPIDVPEPQGLRPNRDYLAERFGRFAAA